MTETEMWNNYNEDLLRAIVNSEELRLNYRYSASYYPSNTEATPLDKIEDWSRGLTGRISYLESVIERLQLYNGFSEATYQVPSSAATRTVFVVHGRDEAKKLSTARFLEKLGLEPIILHEQPNRGKTIIEKFESHASVAFAVVLLTGDDVGSIKSDKPALVPRARQNVILELGYFLGKLGREKVAALYESGVEIPSDYEGVAYIPLDPHDAWKFQLARELKDSGLDIDMNRVV